MGKLAGLYDWDSREGEKQECAFRGSGSRKPDDLPVFCRELVKALEKMS
ncbi:MAG: hypothetical protein ACREKR_08860 [Candidatus Methylomirabilales bacterium]